MVLFYYFLCSSGFPPKIWCLPHLPSPSICYFVCVSSIDCVPYFTKEGVVVTWRKYPPSCCPAQGHSALSVPWSGRLHGRVQPNHQTSPSSMTAGARPLCSVLSASPVVPSFGGLSPSPEEMLTSACPGYIHSKSLKSEPLGVGHRL